ncbi:MAG TPA: Flp family type IVb pilin [Dongiaceae bacterium]|nr:Flp family type IVb pilin [Dongiaceae bacterium]
MIRCRYRAPRRGERRFGAAEAGATAIEYALIAVLISVFIIGALSFTANGVKTTYNVITNAVLGAVDN